MKTIEGKAKHSWKREEESYEKMSNGVEIDNESSEIQWSDYEKRIKVAVTQFPTYTAKIKNIYILREQ